MNKKRDKNIYERILYTIIIVFIARLLTNIPIIGVNKGALSGLYKNNEMFALFDLFSGGGLAKLSMFALSISPYISASIIMQLMGTMVPRLEEIQQEGETGRKKIEKITNILTIIIAALSSLAVTNQFVRMGAIPNTTMYKISTIVSLIAGTGILIFMGKKITDNGIGNGVSLILTTNVLSQIPKDIVTIFNKIVLPSERTYLVGSIVIGFMVLIIFLTVRMHETERKVPLVYSGRLKGKTFVGGDSACFPIKLNPGGVTPVIFTTTLMALPSMIAGLFGIGGGEKTNAIMEMFKTQNWFNPENLKPTLGFLVYATLLIIFAYMYADMNLNTNEIANTLKVQNATIPNVRPGRETKDHLDRIIKGTTLLGAVSLLILCLIPMVLTSLIGAQVGFGGTSLIIVVSVLTEIANQVKVELEARKYSSFIFEE